MNRGFFAVYGLTPGPTQRPLIAGAISGALATIPAAAILFWFRALNVEAAILGYSTAETLAGGIAIMACAGAAYAWLFGRAANAVRGGWLFGMCFAFAVWSGGAVLLLPLLSGGRAPAGSAAEGVALSMVVWGLVTGALVPFVHRPLHESLATGAQRTEVGPTAAAGDKPPVDQQRQKSRN